MPEPYFRNSFRCIFVEHGRGANLSTGISIEVPNGLTRQQAKDYVTGVVAREVNRYAASEAMGFGPFDQSTDWNEIVT